MGSGRSKKVGLVQMEQGVKPSAADLPVMKVDGITFEAINASLATVRAQKENLIENDTFLAYNLLESYKFPDIYNAETTFTDLCILGNVNATPGCNLYISKCQDDAFVSLNTIANKEFKFMAVFDGHGKKDGDKVAKACTYLMSKILVGEELRCTKTGNLVKVNSEDIVVPKRDEIIENPEDFFIKTFRFLHDCVCSASDFSAKEAGTTATIAALVDNTLHLGWVGDSQAALFVTTSDTFEDFIPFFITSRHNFQTDEEKERVKAAGGRVGHGDNIFGRINPNSTAPLRIYNKRANGKPGLMISRSLGDKNAHDIGLTCEPSFISLDFNELGTIGALSAVLPDEFNTSLQDLSSNNLTTKSRRKKRTKPFQSTLGRVRKRVNSTLGRRKSKLNVVAGDVEELPPTALPSQTTINHMATLSSQNTIMTQPTLGGSEEENTPQRTIKHCILVMASDGLWDQLSKQEIARMLPEMLNDRMSNEEFENNISLELGIKAIEKFRKSFTTPTTAAKSDDIAVITNVLF